MKLYYHSKKLEKICTQERAMHKKLGDDMARKLKQRLMELRAADTLSDISHRPPPRPHELVENRAGQFSVDLAHPYRLLFIPANEPIPQKEDGGIDREQVTEVEIIEIADTY